jgi:hypothetical protein
VLDLRQRAGGLLAMRLGLFLDDCRRFDHPGLFNAARDPSSRNKVQTDVAGRQRKEICVKK